MSNNRRGFLPTASMPRSVVKQNTLSADHIYPYTVPDERPFVFTTRHYHWVIQAFDWADLETGGLNDIVTVSVEAQSEEEAIHAAMQAVQRPAYRVASVSESCSLDKDLNPTALTGR